jgi:hypothetical protein
VKVIMARKANKRINEKRLPFASHFFAGSNTIQVSGITSP